MCGLGLQSRTELEMTISLKRRKMGYDSRVTGNISSGKFEIA
jgi:hypothetical protein